MSKHSPKPWSQFTINPAQAQNRGRYAPEPAVGPCAFDVELERLGLVGASLERLRLSEELRAWARRFYTRKWIPEPLLAAFGLHLTKWSDATAEVHQFGRE